MQDTVIIVDPNPAVQALASLALQRAGFDTEAHGNATDAVRAIAQRRPKLVVIANELTDADALQICATAKKQKALAGVRFLLVVERNTPKSIKMKAKKAGVDDILYKPFKSDQLCIAVEKLLGKGVDLKPQQTNVLIVSQERFLARVIGKLLDKRKVQSYIVDSIPKKLGKVDAVVADWDGTSRIDWYDPDTMGGLVLIAPMSHDVSALHITENVNIVSRPLSTEKLSGVFDTFFPDTNGERPLKNHGPLQVAEQATLAAEISAAVFKHLLQQPALRTCDWEEVGYSAQNEVLRVCREFAKQDRDS